MNDILRKKLSREDNVELITKWVVGSIMIFTALEAIFYPETENLYGCVTFLVGWALLYNFVLKVKGKERNKCLLPYLALFGLGICFFWLPLVLTFIEGKPLTFRFENPYLTFNNQLLNLVMLILAYRLCLKVYRPNNPIQRLWKSMGYFTPPTDLQIWVMGIIGLVSYFLILTLQGSDDAKSENFGVLGHLLSVLRTFSSFPFLLLMKQSYGGNPKEKASRIPIIVYFVVILILGLATGKRTAILGPVVTIVICFLLPVFTVNKHLFSVRNTFFILVGIYFVTGPVADMAAAMALGRDNSGNTSASKTFEKVWHIYQDKEMLHNLYQMSLANFDNNGKNDNGWSEYYVDNILFDRFCNIRVCDATLHYAEKLGYDNSRMHDYFEKRMQYLIPTPILRVFGLRTSKFGVQYTPGDLMSTEGLALRHQYVGYRVAGDTGIGLYLWGYKYYIYALFIFFLFFYFLSTKILIVRSGMVILSLPEICDLFRTFLTFNNDTGIIGIITILLRTGWQTILVYCMLYYIVRKIV